jgi:FKBP-type peptidyl-prolyl cis-trans isomerase
MRRPALFALAVGLAWVVGGPAPADDKAEKEKAAKLKRPDLKSDKWKKLGPAGLEYIDEQEGKGEPVKPGATVKLHYTGWLTDEKATIFDSSVKRDEPVEFPLRRLIKGWQEGVPGMKPGGVRVLRIPPDLAYGPGGTPDGTIPPNATLVFRIEVLGAK